MLSFYFEENELEIHSFSLRKDSLNSDGQEFYKYHLST